MKSYPTGPKVTSEAGPPPGTAKPRLSAAAVLRLAKPKQPAEPPLVHLAVGATAIAAPTQPARPPPAYLTVGEGLVADESAVTQPPETPTGRSFVLGPKQPAGPPPGHTSTGSLALVPAQPAEPPAGIVLAAGSLAVARTQPAEPPPGSIVLAPRQPAEPPPGLALAAGSIILVPAQPAEPPPGIALAVASIAFGPAEVPPDTALAASEPPPGTAGSLAAGTTVLAEQPSGHVAGAASSVPLASPTQPADTCTEQWVTKLMTSIQSRDWEAAGDWLEYISPEEVCVFSPETFVPPLSTALHLAAWTKSAQPIPFEKYFYRSLCNKAGQADRLPSGLKPLFFPRARGRHPRKFVLTETLAKPARKPMNSSISCWVCRRLPSRRHVVSRHKP